MDEFDITLRPLFRSPDAQQPCDDGAPEESVNAGRSSIERPSPLLPRGRLVERLARAMTVCAAVFLAASLLLARVSVAAHSPLLIAPGADLFLLEHAVPWGVLTIDGRDAASLGIAALPRADGQLLPWFALPAGRHTVEYRAAPFPPLHCVVSVRAGASDTCPLVHPLPPDPIQVIAPRRILDADAVPQRLPSAQLAALERQVERAIDDATKAALLAPGERYLSANGSTVIADVPLYAAPRFRVNQDLLYSLPALSAVGGTARPSARCILLYPWTPARGSSRRT